MLLKGMFETPFDVAREIDRLFDSIGSRQPFGIAPATRSDRTAPAINVSEDEAHLYAEVDVPGLTMEDVEVLVADDELTVRGTRKTDVPDEARAVRHERAMGAFERTIGLPIAVDTERVEASLSNGVLSITLPKAAPAGPRRIEIKALPRSK